jgi:hypothetical protein
MSVPFPVIKSEKTDQQGRKRQFFQVDLTDDNAVEVVNYSSDEDDNNVPSKYDYDSFDEDSIEDDEVEDELLESNVSVDNHDPTQKKVTDVIFARLFKLPANAIKRPLFVTGGPGSGKTHIVGKTIDALIKATAQIYMDKDPTLDEDMALRRAAARYPVVTPTAMAASMIEGAKTFHSMLGSLAKEPISVAEAPAKILEAIRAMSCMVYDEISMLHPTHFINANKFFQEVRGNNQFFGGVLIIFVGDFFQLPPVIMDDDPIIKKFGSLEKVPLLFETTLWRDYNFEIIELTGSHRQREDPEMTALLNEIRTGHVGNATDSFLRGKVMPYGEFVRELASRDLPATGPIDIPARVAELEAEMSKICFTNPDVERENNAKLALLKGSDHNYVGDYICTCQPWKDVHPVILAGMMSDLYEKETFIASAPAPGGYKKGVFKKPEPGRPGQQYGISKATTSSSYGSPFGASTSSPSATTADQNKFTFYYAKGQRPDHRRMERIHNIKVRTPPVLQLKLGALVVNTFNSRVNKGVINGSRGTVIGFYRKDVWAQMQEGDDDLGDDLIATDNDFAADELVTSTSDDTDVDERYRKAQPTTLSNAANVSSAVRYCEIEWPLVKFTRIKKPVLVMPDAIELEDGVYFAGLPLRLAYAFTVHNQQGQTNRYGYVQPQQYSKRPVQPGIFYVAISRFPKRTNFALASYDKKMIIADPRVVSFYRDIRNGRIGR